MRLNYHFIKHFLTHYLSATRIDVLHSPFVFDLYNTCIAKEKNQKPIYIAIERIRKKARNSTQYITQLDFGANGNNGKTVKKTIGYFTQKHAKPKRIAQIIHRIIDKLKPNFSIEFGTSLGFTTLYIASALTDKAELISIEGAPELASIARNHLKEIPYSAKVRILEGNFDTILPDVLSKTEIVDFAFIDGNHTYEATLNYFNQLLNKATLQTVLIFDDIYWSEGMTKAWEEIKQHPRVNVTIDLFYLGIVFFRTEQAKQHFKLRVL